MLDDHKQDQQFRRDGEAEREEAQVEEDKRTVNGEQESGREADAAGKQSCSEKSSQHARE